MDLRTLVSRKHLERILDLSTTTGRRKHFEQPEFLDDIVDDVLHRRVFPKEHSPFEPIVDLRNAQKGKRYRIERMPGNEPQHRGMQ